MKEWYYDKRIKRHLESDEQGRGPVTQANMHNREHCLLFKLPAELRIVIWELAMTPDLESALWYSDYGQRPEPEYTSSVDIFCRSGRAYPDFAIVAASREIYTETRPMYASIISRFYQNTSFHLNSTGLTPISRLAEYNVGAIPTPSSAKRQIDALSSTSLQKITELMIYHPQWQDTPQFMFKNGAWKGCWEAYSVYNEHVFVTRQIVLYKRSERSTIERLLKKHNITRYEQLRSHQHCRSPHKYDYHIEALLFAPSPSVEGCKAEVIEQFRAAGGLQVLTKEVIKAMLYIQAYTPSRYT